MHNFQRTWIEGYSGGRLVSMKDHCSGNPHVKALRSSKASILNLPAQSGQKEIDINVSQDEMKRLKRKANIAYFAMKNDISFRKYPNLVDLVKKEGNLDVEKDIGTLYVNKEGSRQFIPYRAKLCRAKVTNFLRSDENFARRIVSPDENFARQSFAL